MKKLLLYLCACLLVLSSCSSLKKAVTEKEYIYKTDTLIEYRNIHDSIYVADTIRQKGDTVYKNCPVKNTKSSALCMKQDIC